MTCETHPKVIRKMSSRRTRSRSRGERSAWPWKKATRPVRALKPMLKTLVVVRDTERTGCSLYWSVSEPWTSSSSSSRPWVSRASTSCCPREPLERRRGLLKDILHGEIVHQWAPSEVVLRVRALCSVLRCCDPGLLISDGSWRGRMIVLSHQKSGTRCCWDATWTSGLRTGLRPGCHSESETPYRLRMGLIRRVEAQWDLAGCICSG